MRNLEDSFFLRFFQILPYLEDPFFVKIIKYIWIIRIHVFPHFQGEQISTFSVSNLSSFFCASG